MLYLDESFPAAKVSERPLYTTALTRSIQPMGGGYADCLAPHSKMRDTIIPTPYIQAALDRAALAWYRVSTFPPSQPLEQERVSLLQQRNAWSDRQVSLQTKYRALHAQCTTLRQHFYRLVCAWCHKHLRWQRAEQALADKVQTVWTQSAALQRQAAILTAQARSMIVR